MSRRSDVPFLPLDQKHYAFVRMLPTPDIEVHDAPERKGGWWLAAIAFAAFAVVTLSGCGIDGVVRPEYKAMFRYVDEERNVVCYRLAYSDSLSCVPISR